MISSLQNLFWPVYYPKTAAKSTKDAKTAAAPAFGRIVKSAAAFAKGAPAKPAPALKTAPADLPRLGPMTADPNTHTAGPPPKLPDPIASSPYLPAGFRGDVNLMNRAEHVETMNAWLQNYTKWENDNKTQVYQQAMYNWELNAQRCQELGIDPPPKPTPPTLAPIQNMPAEYWFA
jgi:hypothetical protein